MYTFYMPMPCLAPSTVDAVMQRQTVWYFCWSTREISELWYVHAANALKDLGASDGDVKVEIDFRTIFPLNSTVNIIIWHNTGDDCGAPCYYLHQFLAEMADVAMFLVPGAVYFVLCAMRCVLCTGLSECCNTVVNEKFTPGKGNVYVIPGWVQGTPSRLCRASRMMHAGTRAAGGARWRAPTAGGIATRSWRTSTCGAAWWRTRTSGRRACTTCWRPQKGETQGTTGSTRRGSRTTARITSKPSTTSAPLRCGLLSPRPLQCQLSSTVIKT